MKVLFNYAHLKFYQSQKLNTSTGYGVGGFDKVYEFKYDDIDLEYRDKYKHILNQPRGAGYWIWKYYFAKKLLNDDSIPEGSFIFYADAGCYFVGSIDQLISVMNRDNISIMTFRQNHQAFALTKRDAFILTETDEPKYTHSAMRCGGWFLLRKNDESRKFIDECYNYSIDYRIITDSPNEMGLENYSGFFDHRHDESVISIVSKKWNLYPYRNPSQDGYDYDVTHTDNIYGDEGTKRMFERGFSHMFFGKSLKQYPELYMDDKSTYPTIIILHRNSN
jgi:hypothetical protein